LTKPEIEKAIETQLDSLGKLIKTLEDSNYHGLMQKLRQSFEYLLASSLEMKFLPEEPAAPKLMRRSLF
jgi:hypothetical protein